MLDRGAPEDPLEIEQVLWRDAAGRLAFDVGANMGQSVGRLLSRGFTEVWAFEPAVESFEILQRDYGGDSSVHCWNEALSDHDGTLTTAVRQAPILTGQLVAAEMPYHGEGSGPALAAWGPETGRRDVPCTTLDAVADESGVPDFVKIDTEGHELQVLRGGPRLLKAGTRLLIEFHTDVLHDSCAELLEQSGYDVETVRHPHYPPDSYMWSRHGWLKASKEK